MVDQLQPCFVSRSRNDVLESQNQILAEYSPTQNLYNVVWNFWKRRSDGAPSALTRQRCLQPIVLLNITYK